MVIDPLPPRRRIADRAAALRLREAVGLQAAAEAVVGELRTDGVEEPLLAARLTASVEELGAAVAGSGEIVRVGPEPCVLIGRKALARLEAEALEVLVAYHRDNPLRTAMPREELRARVFGTRAAAAPSSSAWRQPSRRTAARGCCPTRWRSPATKSA